LSHPNPGETGETKPEPLVAQGPPNAVAICLRLMIALDLSVEDAAKFLKMRRG
jgi:hypothetical protein